MDMYDVIIIGTGAGGGTLARSLAPSGKREVILAGIPLGGGHRARNIAIGQDGALYVIVGSNTNSCQKKDRAPESPGVDPCV